MKLESMEKPMYTLQATKDLEMSPKKKPSDSKKPPTRGIRVDGFTYYLSTRPKKKLMVRVDGNWIHFGSRDYEHFHDRTGLLPKDLNHHDKSRREFYLKRSRGIRDGEGKLTAEDPKSSNYHAIRILW